MIVIPETSRGLMLDILLKDQGLNIHLFKNNLSPDDSTILSDFQEADFTGYAPIGLVSGSFTTTLGTPSITTHDPVVFTSSAQQGAVQTCYGYYITRVGTGDLWYCERFTGTPPSVENLGDTITITPTVSL